MSKRSERLSKEEVDHLLDEALEGTFPASDPVAVSRREKDRDAEELGEARRSGRNRKEG